MAEVKVVGVERLVNALERLEKASTTPQIHKALAEIVLFGARNRVPIGPSRPGHRGGALSRSGRASGTKSFGSVRFGGGSVPYAGPIHFGHAPRAQGGFTVPQPFLYDAADERSDAVLARFLEHLDKVIGQVGLG